jgi:hypothetical protein
MAGRRFAVGWLVIAVLVGVVPRPPAFGDRKMDEAKARFAAKRRAILFEAGTARVRLGEWCRDAGLVAQATACFVKAVDESEDTNWWAKKVLDLMRAKDDKFWKTVVAHPTKAYLDTFEKKARRLDDDREGLLFRLAHDGWKAEMFDDAQDLWCDLIRQTDRPLVLKLKDDKEVISIPSGDIPADISAKIKAAAITVNGQLYVRDDFLELVPQVKELSESTGERVRIRVEGAGKESAKSASDLLASLEALLPYLEDDLGGRPTKRIHVFVFSSKATYGAWVGAAKMGAFTAASGFADGPTNTAVISGEGIGVDGLRGMCLHEMSHLFMYGVTPVVMPSWYAEGFAETYGGQGTFEWKDGKLAAGGKLDSGYLAPLKAEGYIPLSDLIAGDALKLLTKDKALGRRFYSESWAFLRWLRTASAPELQARCRLWETACRGAGLGVQAGKPREQDTNPATSEFSRRFGSDLAAMETSFKAWLAGL